MQGSTATFHELSTTQVIELWVVEAHLHILRSNNLSVCLDTNVKVEVEVKLQLEY